MTEEELGAFAERLREMEMGLASDIAADRFFVQCETLLAEVRRQCEENDLLRDERNRLGKEWDRLTGANDRLREQVATMTNERNQWKAEALRWQVLCNPRDRAHPRPDTAAAILRDWADKPEAPAG